MKFEVYKSSTSVPSQVWRWRLIAANGEPIASSGEGYRNKQDCLHAIDLIKSTDTKTTVVEV